MGRVAVLGMICIAWSATANSDEATGIQRLAWLQGCWEASSAERVVEEHWMAPRGDSMVGVSRTLRGERLVEYELVVIRQRAADLVYIAHPSGQASAEFIATSVATGRVVFENPEHDFPQVIGYERRGASLLAWVEGRQGEKVRRIEFPYRRTGCEGE